MTSLSRNIDIEIFRENTESEMQLLKTRRDLKDRSTRLEALQTKHSTLERVGPFSVVTYMYQSVGPGLLSARCSIPA